jgi:hypothetical protein
VRQHLVNSRVEFLKAIREVIDDRIDHLTTEADYGTKISVEWFCPQHPPRRRGCDTAWLKRPP